jgi:hypothetical protein
MIMGVHFFALFASLVALRLVAGLVLGVLRWFAGAESPATRSYLQSLPGASPESHRSTLVSQRGYYGETPARLRRGPQDRPVQGWMEE